MSRENSNVGLWAIIVGFAIFCLGGLAMVYTNISHAPVPATISANVGDPAVEAPAEAAPVETVPAAPTEVTVAQINTITYTVVKGDTLWSIAERTLGDAHRWTELWSENQGQIDNPDLIFPGQVLTITTVDKSTSNLSPDHSVDPPSEDPDQGSLSDVSPELPPGTNPLIGELRVDQRPKKQ